MSRGHQIWNLIHDLIHKRAIVPLFTATLALSLVAAGAEPAEGDSHAAAAEEPDVVVTTDPAPGSVVPPDMELALRATVPGGAEDEADVQVDGTAIEAESSADGDTLVVSGVIPPLDPGDIDARIRVGDVDHQWQFHVTDTSVERFAGPDRIETAVAASQQLFDDDGAEEAVIARADELVDALAGAPLAADRHGPLLLTGSDALDPRAAEELERALDDDATVHLLGGEQALSDEIASELSDLGFAVQRHHGRDRIATAMAVATELSDPDRVVVVGADADMDAATASAVAARAGWPVLLTPSDRFLGRVGRTIDSIGVERVHVVGGTAAVSERVIERLDDLGFDADRTSGPTRFDTATALAERWPGGADGATLVGGESLPDALTGAVLAAEADESMLLVGTQHLPGPTGNWLDANAPQHLQVMGGTAAVSQRVVQASLARLAGGDAALVETPSSTERPISTIDLEFTDQVDAENSTVSVRKDGVETLVSTIATGSTLEVQLPAEVPSSSGSASLELWVRASTSSGDAFAHAEFTATRPDGPVMYLTFDDGPNPGGSSGAISPQSTPGMLDVLGRHDAAATFFVTGSSSNAYPDLLRQIHDEGHRIENHTWGHPNLTRLSNSRIVSEITRTQDIIAQHTGQVTTCLRPPGGNTNSRVRGVIEAQGHEELMWDIDPQDWRRQGADAIANHVISRAHDGAVVVLHDGGGNRSQTVQAVDRILRELGDQGYWFDSICNGNLVNSQ